MLRTQNLHVVKTEPLVAPRVIKRELPGSDALYAVVVRARATIRDIIAGRDGRLLALVGPCSIHDPEAARDYARRLAALAARLADKLFVVMRVYFEKPRTTIGWKGLINDPHLNGTHDMQLGLRLARQLLVDLARLGLPAGTELLDPITPQYLADLISWAAIGARTTESQTHREMASGLSMPVGFKDTTDGNQQVAIDALESARHPHTFLGIDQDGVASVIHTEGNPDGHIILRGWRTPRYDAWSIRRGEELLLAAGLPALVLAGQLLGVHVGEADDPHVRVGAADLRPPETDVLDGGHDPAEEQRAELAHHLGGLDVADAFLDREADRLPHLLGEEAVAHQVAGLDREFFSLVAFRLRELRVVVTQREPPEGDVPRLVLHDVGVHRRGERVLRLVADGGEGGEREPLDQHLHAEVGHVPARVAEDVVEQALERRRDRVGEVELLVQEARVGLHMARLVHHLRGGVEFGVDARHLLHDLGGADERPLLAVQELRELPGLEVAPEGGLLLAREPLPHGRAEDRDRLVGQLLRIFRIEVLRPVDAGVGVPLELLALLVEVHERGAALLVLPAKDGVEGVPPRPGAVLDRNGVAAVGRHGALRGSGLLADSGAQS